MSKPSKMDINEIFLEAHLRGMEHAVDISIRTGVPLVVSRKGKIVEMHPQYKYVMVPIKPLKKTILKKKSALSY